MSYLARSAALLALMANLAHAEAAATDHGLMMMAVPDGASDATRGYVEAMNRMAMAMASEFTGTADRDFIIGMIPHHQAHWMRRAWCWRMAATPKSAGSPKR